MSGKVDIAGKRCLITGVSGFFGANLARELLSRGAEVCGTVRDGSDLWRIRDITNDIVLAPADLTDLVSVEQAVRLAAPDLIFNTSVGRGSQSAMSRVNVTGVMNLIEATRNLNYQRLVHYGSSMEYGRHQLPLTETMPAAPVSPYAETKAVGTAILRAYAQAANKPVVVLRPFSVYGFWEGPARLIPAAFVAARDGHALPLTGPGIRRDLVFVEDVIEASLLAAVADLACGETINVASGRQYDNTEVVDAIGRAAGRSIDIIAGAYAPHESDTDHWLADISKAEELLGWQPRHTLETGLARTAAWLDDHGHFYQQLTTSQVRA